ncbi:MAG: ABC transporter substrate-binding protein [Xanthobacteraceae bacterium]
MRIDRRTLLGGLAATFVTPLPSFAASITDATDRTIAGPDRVMGVYPAGPPAAVEIYTLAPDLLVGWLEPISPEARQFLLPDIAARPEIPRLTGRGDAKINVDALKSFKPDLIVDIGDVNDAYKALAERVQQESGIPYVLIDGHLDRMSASYRTLGQLLGRNNDAEKLARIPDETIAAVTSRVASVPSEARPRVYYARDHTGLITAQAGSMVTEPIAFLGARNVAGDKRGGQTVTTVAQVAEWNPDIIIASNPEFMTLVRRDPAWASIAAVKNGRVHLSPKLPFGWVDYPPAVNRLIGLWWLGKVFYPDRFPEDIKAQARDFYTAFYHVTPTAEQIDRVLAGGG